MSRPSSPVVGLPWRLTDMLILYVFTAIGFATLGVAWWGASGTTSLSHGVTWLDVGAAGLMVLGTGNCFWLLTARRAVGDRRRRLLSTFESVPAAEPVASAERGGPQPVAATGMGHYHRPDCQLVAGKSAAAAPAAEHEADGRAPCGMCRP